MMEWMMGNKERAMKKKKELTFWQSFYDQEPIIEWWNPYKQQKK